MFWLLKYIFQNTQAPTDVQKYLAFSKSSIVADYNWNNRRVILRAGVKILTEDKLYHNRADVLVHITNPDEIFVIEVYIAHLQNIEIQEKIKNVRYSDNSVMHITPENVNNAPRDNNIVDHLKKTYKCPANLVYLVFDGDFT